MIHDYWMHRQDDQFVQSFLPGIQTVLWWFIDKIDPQTGLLQSKVPHWNFVDWATSWKLGVAPESDSLGSAVTSLQFAAALQSAAELMEQYGKTEVAKEYETICRNLKRAVYEKCWDAERGLLRDYIGSETFSQHANIMGILTDAIPERDQQAVFERIVEDPSITQTTFYYKFYLIRALKKVGLADRYTQMLEPWQRMIDMGSKKGQTYSVCRKYIVKRHSLSTPFPAKKRIIFPFPVFYGASFCVSIGLERMKCDTA